MSVGVIGCHVLQSNGEGDGLALPRLQQVGLGKVNQVDGRLFNSAVVIGRRIVDLYHVLACLIAGIGHRHVKDEVSVPVGSHRPHLLGELGIAQAIAEGILHSGIVVQEALLVRRLVEFIAHIDALYIVYKGDDGVLLRAELLHVRIAEVTDVVEVIDGGQIIYPGIHQAAGGIDRAVEHGAQSIEAGLPGAGDGDHAADVVVLLHPAQLKCVGAVVHHDHVFISGSDIVDHFPLGFAQLQERLALCEIAGISFVGDRRHVGGQVSALAAHTGDHDERRVGKIPGAVQQFLGVLAHHGLRQRPVLLHPGDSGPVGAVGDIEVGQLRVQLKSGVFQAVQQGDGGGGVYRAGARPAVTGVGGGPSEHI